MNFFNFLKFKSSKSTPFRLSRSSEMQSFFFTSFNLISIAEDEESVLKKELHDYKEGTKQLLEKMRELQGK